MQEIRDRQRTCRTVPGSPTRRGAWRLARAGGLRLRQIMGSVLVVIVLAAVPAMAQAGALHRVVKAGDLDGLTRLLAFGADVDARDNRGWTALMYAADKGYVLSLEPLLAAKADPNVRAPDGPTALFLAVAHGHSEIITMLMEAGADPTIKGPKGMTTRDVAYLQYRNINAALANQEPPAVIALLTGKTLAESKELARTWQETIPQETTPGSVFLDCDKCPEMVVIPAGSYQMGDLSGEGDSDERPVHRVTIEYPFAVGKYEVTFDEWDACVAAGGCSYQPDDEGWGRGTRPVIHVSWHDAQEYVKWLSRETGKPYRLLSEAEWEYVARAGTTTTYWWGDDVYANIANFDGCGSGHENVCGSQWRNKSASVGSFAANTFRVFDTAGNVWEWVEDCWNDNYKGAPTDGRVWTSGECGRRVLRGGSWSGIPENVRPTFRNGYISVDRVNDVGFRVASWMLTP